MENIIKYIWVTMIFAGSLAIIFNTPYEVWKKAYMDEVHRIQVAPIRRIDATNRYIEAIESGQEDISRGIRPTPPAKYYRNVQYEKVKRVGRVFIYDYDGDIEVQPKPEEKKYQKPLYIRDENNPDILHKVY
jgi:hypothetical protein